MVALTQIRSNNFNLMRLLFASLVLLSHAPELKDGNRSRELLTSLFHTISFGELAVDGFFLISGYLIVQSWNTRPQIWDYLKKRVLRIYPGFIAATLISVFLVGPLASDPKAYFSSFWVGGFVKGLLFLQAPSPAPVFAHTPYALLNGAMWTISFEFECYLLVLLFGVAGAFRNRVLWIATAACCFGLFLLHQFGAAPLLTWPLIRLSCFFFSGGCFFLFRDRIAYSPPIAAVFAAALIASLFFSQVAEIALATAGAYLIFYFSLIQIRWIEGFNHLPDVSYGVYLYGWPVQKLLLWYFPSMSPWLLFPVSLMLCLVLGACSWYAVEKPMMKLKSKPVVPSTSAGPVQGSIVQAVTIE